MTKNANTGAKKYHPQAEIYARDLRTHMTEAETRLWQALRGKQLAGLKFRRQQPVGRFIVDFVCTEMKVIVELDGGQHAEARGYDQERDVWLENAGYMVLRFWNNEIFENLEGVLMKIADNLASSPPPQPSPLKGEGVDSVHVTKHAGNTK